jgi:GNAT superfamily N-acetyltransferase
LIAASEAEGFRFLRRIPREFHADPAYLNSAKRVVLGAFHRTELAGVGGLTPDPYVDDPAIGRVRHVYVAATHRRRGIGRLLIRALEDRALGVYVQVRLRTDSPAAAAFYETLAYQPIAADNATHTRSLRAGVSAPPT